jgi:hypothetical protein
MADYTPLTGLTENDIRTFVTPPLEYDDVTKQEILLKIESVETYLKYRYFDGGSVPATAKIPVLLLVISNLICTPTLARKYYTLSSEKLGSYSYTLAEPISRGLDIQSSPFIITKTWHRMAIEMLEKMQSPSEYIVRKAND